MWTLNAAEEKPRKLYESFYSHQVNPKTTKEKFETLATETHEEIQSLFKKLSQIKKENPQDILKSVEKLPTCIPMNSEEKKRFIEIKEALGSSQIIPALMSQINAFQLGLLWNEYENKRLSWKLFRNLISIRIENIEPKKSLFCPSFVPCIYCVPISIFFW